MKQNFCPVFEIVFARLLLMVRVDCPTLFVRMVVAVLNDAKGPEMNQAETVTILNDMCFMAPGSLINKNITWETMDASQVKATFTSVPKEISATSNSGLKR